MSNTALSTHPDASSSTGAPTKDFLSTEHLSEADYGRLYAAAAALKADPASGATALRGKSVILIFEKPSLRTRVTFEVGVTKLGGSAFYYDHSSYRLGEREAVKDYGKNLHCWVDCIVARVYSHVALKELAENTSIPVVNALSDRHHPCQALTDLFTLQEKFGTLSGLRLAFIGDGNNVCHSLMLACARLGVSMTVITPNGFEPQFDVLRKALALCEESGATIRVTNDASAVVGHEAIYTDKWVSMGQEQQKDLRSGSFWEYQVNADLMSRAGENAVFMHCLPAARGLEVTDDVIDSAQSLVFKQAENRMHVQNALLMELLGSA